jgi:hypothetical protein
VIGVDAEARNKTRPAAKNTLRSGITNVI